MDGPEQELKQGDMDNPRTPFEAEMFEACSHAETHLREGYQAAMECGLNTTLAKSTGTLLGLTRVLGAHMIQHCSNMLLPKELVANEIRTIVKNLEMLVDENYDMVLEHVMSEMSAKETKQ